MISSDAAFPTRRGQRDPILLVRIALLAACLSLLLPTAADPDLWGHVAFGRDSVATGAIARTDPYSFTSDRPWINHEWLAEVAMFGAYRAAGGAGLVLLKLALVLGLIGIAAWQLQRSALAPIARDALTVLLVMGIFMRATFVRPQLFSLLLFGVMLTVMRAAERDRWRLVAAFPLLMAAWANLHGGWVVGLGVLGIWTAFVVVRRDLLLRQRVWVAVAGIAAVLATLVNPYGLGLWRFIYQTVGLARPDVADWLPVYRLPPAIFLPWLLVAGTAVVAGIRCRRHAQLSSLAIVGLLVVGSLRVSRLDAFLAIALVVLLGPPLGEAIRRRQTRAVRPAHPAGAAVMAAAIALFPVGVAARSHPLAVTLDLGFLPEPEAVQFALANQLKGRMLTWYDWGEYALWHLSPGVKVSLDARRETVYTDAVLNAHYDFYFAKPGTLDYPGRIGAEYIWLPHAVPASRAMEQAGWVPIFDGPISVILARPGSRSATSFTRSGPVGHQAVATFPGP